MTPGLKFYPDLPSSDYPGLFCELVLVGPGTLPRPIPSSVIDFCSVLVSVFRPFSVLMNLFVEACGVGWKIDWSCHSVFCLCEGLLGVSAVFQGHWIDGGNGEI